MFIFSTNCLKSFFYFSCLPYDLISVNLTIDFYKLHRIDICLIAINFSKSHQELLTFKAHPRMPSFPLMSKHGENEKFIHKNCNFMFTENNVIYLLEHTSRQIVNINNKWLWRFFFLSIEHQKYAELSSTSIKNQNGKVSHCNFVYLFLSVIICARLKLNWNRSAHTTTL